MQTLAELTARCLHLPHVTHDQPFGPDVTVFRVGGKIFALLGEDDGRPHLILKCEPDWALALREIYAAITPGYHMNKRHWNSIRVDGSVPVDELAAMIDHAYARVWQTLTKAQRAALETPTDI